MKFSLVAALGLGLGTVCFKAAAQDAPRELGGAPVLPAPPARSAASPPTRPAADSARAAALPTAAEPPASARPTYEGPDSPGRSTIGGTGRAARYQVGLKNGTLYTVSDVEVKSPLFSRSYLQLDGQRHLELSEVSFYEDQTGHYVRATLAGSAHETTLRRERVGRLSLYATYTTSYSPGGFMPGYGYGGYSFGGYSGGSYRTTKTEYFSKENGPIQRLSARNLTEATTDNASVQALLARARNYRTGIILSYVAAGGLLAAGFSQSVRTSATGISPIYYAVIPVLVLPLIFQSKQASLQRQAITLYNSEP